MQGNDTLSNVTLRFTEEMKGYATFAGASRGGAEAVSGDSTPCDLMFHLDITVPDVTRFVRDPGHTALAEGIVRCARLGGDCLVVEGSVNLLFDVRGPAYKMMRYHLHFVTPSGEAFTLSGIKQVRDNPGCDLWSDTSTLHTSILRGHVPVHEINSAELAASGVLYIHVRDFLTQLGSFKVDAESFADRSAALCRFGTFFLGSLWEVYGEKAA